MRQVESCGYDDVKKIKGKYICSKCKKVMEDHWIFGLTKKQVKEVESRK